MRLKLDENLPSELARLFIEAGHDAVTVLDQDIGGATDAIVASVCLSEGRAIVTMDTHFADIRGYPPHLYPGISSVSTGHPDPRPCAGDWRQTPPNIVGGSASRSAMDRGRFQGLRKRLTQ